MCCVCVCVCVCARACTVGVRVRKDRAPILLLSEYGRAAVLSTYSVHVCTCGCGCGCGSVCGCGDHDRKPRRRSTHACSSPMPKMYSVVPWHRLPVHGLVRSVRVRGLHLLRSVSVCQGYTYYVQCQCTKVTPTTFSTPLYTAWEWRGSQHLLCCTEIEPRVEFVDNLAVPVRRSVL